MGAGVLDCPYPRAPIRRAQCEDRPLGESGGRPAMVTTPPAVAGARSGTQPAHVTAVADELRRAQYFVLERQNPCHNPTPFLDPPHQKGFLCIKLCASLGAGGGGDPGTPTCMTPMTDALIIFVVGERLFEEKLSFHFKPPPAVRTTLFAWAPSREPPF